MLTRVNTVHLGPMNPLKLASLLWADSSPHAICKGDWQQLLLSCETALATAGDAFAPRTAKQDQSNWKAWTAYCSVMGANPMRPPVDPNTDRLGFLREVVLLVNALTYFMRTHAPRSHADKVMKPQSAMNILLGANRVLRASYSSFIPLKALTLPLKGLMRQFIQKFGPLSLIPKRREPFSVGMIETLVNLPVGTKLGRLSLSDNSLERKSWRGAVTLANSLGLRKAEMFKSDATTFFMTWLLVSWCIGGQLIANPTDAQLLGLTIRDFLLIFPPPSKSDQTNQVWGAHPAYVPFRNNLRNAAAAIRDLALAVGEERRSQGQPLFVDSSYSALTASVMATALFHAMTMIVGGAAKLYTWHSARISLATRLHKCGVKPSVIQAMLRWQTAESLRTYCRMSMEESAALLDRAAEATVASVQTSNIPLYEKFDFFLALQKVVDEIP